MASSQKHAILIGIPSYLDKSHLSGMPYAETDVGELRQTLLGLGYPKENIIVLVNEQATKTTIEHYVKSLKDVLNEDDTFLFFFAGHGFSTAHSNFLAGFDTQSADLVGTGIVLGDLLKKLRSSRCRRIQLFLDCCQNGIVSDPRGETLDPELSESALEREIEEAENVACFVSCRSRETSYSSDRLKRGIWSYHLVRALQGDEPGILAGDGLLTAGSLQDHLHRAVPLTVRETFNDRRNQTPWSTSSLGLDAPIADLTPVLAKKLAEGASRSNEIHDIVFKHESHVPIRSLAGYVKPMAMPKGYSHFTQSFVVKLAQVDLEQEIEAMHSQIQRGLKYTRKQIQVTRPSGTESATIWTPDFQYSITIKQRKDDPSEAVIERELSEVRNEDILNNEQFRAIFGTLFTAIQMTFAKPVNVVEIIDAIEALGGSKMEVDYPTDLSYCNISIENCPGAIRINDNRLELTFSERLPLPAMVEVFKVTLQSMHRIDVDGHLALPGPKTV